MNRRNRRRCLQSALAAMGGAAMVKVAKAAVLTPKAAEGPFYPTERMRFADVDNDLVKVEGQVKEAGGEILMLSGQIRTATGEPLANHRIEIWQCDVNGKYLHTGDDRQIPYDTGFQGFGHDVTDGDGRYQFRTIIPTRYPGRTPHIHVKVCLDDKELITTQFYIAGEADNQRDSLYRRLSDEQAARVSMAITQSNGIAETTVDVII